MDVSIKLEALSLIIVVIVGLFHYDKSSRHIKRYNLFNVCLILTAGTIISDIISCVMIENVSAYPVWLHMIVHSLYFACINSCMSMVAGYVFFLLFEYMPNQKCYKIAKTLVCTMWSILMLLIVVNIWTGCYFYIENDAYCRGPLNKLGFAALLIEAGMLCMCYFRNRKVVTPYALQLVRAIPPLITTLTIIQLCFPDIVLTGTIAAYVNLILFACFQSNRIGRDALTELQNRSRFFEQLRRYKEKGKCVHVVLVHLREFSNINKHFGMKGGDAILFKVARYLENLNPEYQVFRYGNTHFTMLGDFTTIDEAERLTNEIMHRFTQAWEIDDNECNLRIQLVHMKIEASEIDENTKVEQLAFLLAKDKDSDESTKRFFDEEEKKSYERKKFVLRELKKAIKNEGFELYFQPIYSCKEKKFLSAEVLLRLFTEDGSMISPGEFIPIAEEYNLSDDITWLVLKKSMMFIEANPDLPLETISVNMSVQQLEADYLYENIKKAQNRFGVLLFKLRIEITENLITQNPELISQIMRFVTNEGAPFYLDDFGVGYSNLARIFDLPFEVIKLDRSLMLKIEQNEKAYNIMKSLVATLHSAGFKVIGEGLETEHQVALAKEIGVDRIQGFYYARPMCEADLKKFLEEHK